MTDTLTKEQRSSCMSRIRGKNTRPEIAVRHILTKLGLRYRLHVNKLPGKPDVVLLRQKIAIFVNGCFWHQHEGCKRRFIPKSNVSFWEDKLTRNINRQKLDISNLQDLGWNVLVIWECETKYEDTLTSSIIDTIGMRK